jgi:eukaryotic-like serine/threonine-protein kinase
LTSREKPSGLVLLEEMHSSVRTLHLTGLDAVAGAQLLAEAACSRHEALLLAPLRHPSIVQIFDEGQHDDFCFLVLEFIEGTSLLHELHHHHRLTVERALKIAYAVALALGAAHRSGVIHQDVKPSNLMLGQHGEIKLIDFGIAGTCQEQQQRVASVEHLFWGTPQYLAPEQAQGHRISPATDIYALGVVLYEMLLGRPPFLGETPIAIVMQHIWNVPPSPFPTPRLRRNIPPFRDILPTPQAA